MSNRFENRTDDCRSCAAANESFCARSSRPADNSALMLTLDTAFAVSIFAVLRLIIIRIISVIVILSGSLYPARPDMELVQ